MMLAKIRKTITRRKNMILIKTIYQDGEVEFCYVQNLTELTSENKRLKKLGVKFKRIIIWKE